MVAASCFLPRTTSRAEGPPGDRGEGWAAQPSPIPWESRPTATLPEIDGRLDDVWQSAKTLNVFVREALGGDHPKPVTLRALHTKDTLYVAAQWPDKTKSDQRDPYVWDAEKKAYERSSRPDDQFALEFAMKGDFTISMLTVMREFTADVWHWKAGRGNPIGWVDDKYHVISQTPVPGAKQHALHGGRSVYILRALDAGTPSYKVRPAPATHEGDVVDSYEPQPPTGSAADVRGKGVHDGDGWTLEMARRLDTGHPEDDAVLAPGRPNLCAIAVLDDELYEEHSVSTLIALHFADAPAAGE
ncbi:MAG: hypothetical protein HYU66_06625 [Armatimonadetes bacterium]|nr:hypothetical protein [Armatimonadota bacterium]